MIPVREASSRETVRTASTEDLRSQFLVEGLFVSGEANAVLVLEDRLVIAGIVPDAQLVGLDHLTEQLSVGRESGVVNLGSPGEVLVDGEAFGLDHRDGLYVGRGRNVQFRGEGARFYLVSTLAHAEHPTTFIPFASVDPVRLGSTDGAGARSLHRYVWGGGDVDSCQLQFGVTVLDPGSVWNTFPPHLHARRTEIYLYFELAAEARVIHLLGEPEHTRHVVVADEQAVIAPGWSIHSGVGTAQYSFVWAMAGENRDYGDLEPVAIEALR